MDKDARQPAPKVVTSIFPALVLLAVAILLVVWSQQYGQTARQFPTMVAVTLMILSLLDLWSRTSLPGRRFIRDFWGTEFEKREMTHNPPVREEVAVIAWVLGLFAGMAVIGILPTLPLFCFLYMVVRARRPVVSAAAISVLVAAFVFIVFEWVLEYELYRGLLFSRGGVSSW